ncbi:MAG TPA: NADH dehydrogenase (quinone) subunit D [Anaerolineae bacterium]|nr:NADH dehydrogenase (quinone) subunit D [Anaerolineae bacterium]
MAEGDTTVERLKARFPEAVLEEKEFRGETTVELRADDLVEVCRFLRDDSELKYEMLTHVTGVDYSAMGLNPRFATVYELYSLEHRRRLRLKVPLASNPPAVPSVTPIWPGANWHERETYDLMGIVFEGHPDLRRIMMPDDWQGHPLRKDYPIEGEPVVFSATADYPELESIGTQVMEAPSPEPSLPPGVDPEKYMVLNFGPQHPATHGVLRVVLELDGETMVSAHPDIGHLHSGIEKTAESKIYQQVIPYTDRLDYVAAMNNNLPYILAVEKLLDVEIPPRAQYLRVLCCELQRLGAHLIWLGTSVLDLSGTIMSLLMYCFRDREAIYNLFEMICGARQTPSYFCIGGVRWDAPPGWVDAVRAFVNEFPHHLADYDAMLTKNPIFKSRTVGIGVLSPEDALALGVTGPCLRGTGVDYDVRKYAPYSSYQDFEFDIPTQPEGDVYARYLVRMEEMRQSVRIIRQALDRLPDGPVRCEDRKITLPPREELDTSMEALIHQFKLVTEGFSPPAGEVYVGCENPKGELGFYVVSDGSPKPYRLKIRGPSFSNLQAAGIMAQGQLLSDMVAIIGSIDITLGEVDR